MQGKNKVFLVIGCVTFCHIIINSLNWYILLPSQSLLISKPSHLTFKLDRIQNVFPRGFKNPEEVGHKDQGG